MPQFASVTRRSLVHRGVCGAALAATILAAGSAAAGTKDHDMSLDRLSDQGVFRVRILSQVTPIPVSRVHQWTISVTDRAGRPVSGAAIAVDGGMPEHHHGLPTAPRATPDSTPGAYIVNGMKFSMTGWWVLKLTIRSTDGRTDTITFNLVL